METDKLFYYSKSKDCLAGKGKNEFVSYDAKYAALNEIKNWRQILSNFYVEPFVFNGAMYNSVEHAFQATKIAIADTEKARYFTIESNHDIGRGDGGVAQKNRKLVKLNEEQLKYWESIKLDVMTDITRERIRQSAVYKKTLLATMDAELWHIQVRKTPIRNTYLEELRYEFR